MLLTKEVREKAGGVGERVLELWQQVIRTKDFGPVREEMEYLLDELEKKGEDVREPYAHLYHNLCFVYGDGKDYP